MSFSEEWSAPHKDDGGLRSPFILRLYRTNRPGTYGYQFAAILWVFDGYLESLDSSPFCSSLTTGCGYNKIASCVASVLASYHASTGDPNPYAWEPVKLAESGRIPTALALAFDIPSDYLWNAHP